MAGALMPRQPYSEAVPSTGGLGSGLRTLPRGFLSPTRGTERVVKTIEDRWGKNSISPLQRPHYITSSYTFFKFSCIIALLSSFKEATADSKAAAFSSNSFVRAWWKSAKDAGFDLYGSG